MLLETVYSWKRVGKSYAQKETARNEFSGCLGIWGLLSPYFLTVGDKNRERKYQHLALRFKREEEVANLVREVKVLPEEVCFHLPWSWVGCFDVWNLSTFKIVRSGRKVSNRRKKNVSLCTDPSEGRSSPNTSLLLGCSLQEYKESNSGLNFLEAIFIVHIYLFGHKNYQKKC